MRIIVKIDDKCIAVPCADETLPIKWLIWEALKRTLPAKSRGNPDCVSNYVLCLLNGGVLWPEDAIADVLESDEFVELKEIADEDDCNQATSNQEKNLSKKPNKGYIPPIVLDGSNLTIQQLLQLSKGEVKVQISDESLLRVKEGRDLVDQIIKEKRVVYGINTGFGKFASEVISPEKLRELQRNLIRSHASGVGEALTPERTRMLMVLRMNVLAKGYSGISLETLKQIVDAFNASCLPWVPEQGTVGASGDLAPLAHLALGLMGEGKMWSQKSGWADAGLVLAAHGLKLIQLQSKEGLAMINGTQMMTSLGAEALHRAEAISRQADIIAAMSLECLKGTTRAFDSRVHRLRPHPGQLAVAQRLRTVLNSKFYPSKISESHRFCNRVQDAYTLRCCPQVHGVVLDTIGFVKGILTTEMNSATDNPMIFAEFGETISGGNFHGEYPAKVLDYLAIAVHELSSMSERRIERLVNPAYSELPAFLVENGGLNSGFMSAHITAASLVSENKVLCHPSSVDSLSTSGGTEDHVSMGGFAARKVLKIVENVERVLAIELLAACQGIEFLRPLTTTQPLEAVHSLVRTHVKAWDKDRYMAPDMDKATELVKNEKVWEVVSPFIDKYMASSSTKDLEARPSSPTGCSLKDPRKMHPTGDMHSA